jgi:acyl-CoA thioesterase-1
LEGVALVPALNQADGIHPNREGVAVIVEKIMPYVIDFLDHLDAGGRQEDG